MSSEKFHVLVKFGDKQGYLRVNGRIAWVHRTAEKHCINVLGNWSYRTKHSVSAAQLVPVNGEDPVL